MITPAGTRRIFRFSCPHPAPLRQLTRRAQELGSMYDYLAKIILLGPSGCGKYGAPYLSPCAR